MKRREVLKATTMGVVTIAANPKEITFADKPTGGIIDRIPVSGTLTLHDRQGRPIVSATHILEPAQWKGRRSSVVNKLVFEWPIELS